MWFFCDLTPTNTKHFDKLTSADSSSSIFQDNYLVNLSIFVKYRSYLALVKMFWYLAYEELQRICVLCWQLLRRVYSNHL